MLIRNATIYTAVAPEPFVGDVRVCNGKILAVGPNLEAPGEPVVDATGLNLYPRLCRGARPHRPGRLRRGL